MKLRTTTAALLSLVVASPALGQPTDTRAPATGDVPLVIDSNGVGNVPPAPRPTAPSGPSIKVITIGADGRPIEDAPDAPTGVYYDDGPAAPTSETLTLHAGPTPELHVVRTGDTLWDICWYYFNDPWQWPKVWSYNPQITNPHWIYPGDLVRLVPRGMTVSIAPSDPETPIDNPDDTVAPLPARSYSVSLRQTAFIDDDELRTPLQIDGSVEAKELLSQGDLVYVSYPANKPPKVGARYSIYTVGNSVEHPRTGKNVGAYVHVLGELQIQSVKKDKRATGIITQSSEEIIRGNFVGPLQRDLKTVSPTAAEVDAQGTIIAMLAQDQLIGQGEVVFLDLGEKSGLKRGNRMYVVRRGDPLDLVSQTGVGQDDRRFPAHALGEIMVVDVGPKVTIGLVTLAVQEMGVGDLVIMQAAK